MATVTLGTNATTTLAALAFSRAPTQADFASIQQAIKYDSGPQTGAVYPGGFTRAGLLFIPQRGVLQVRPGDYVGVDSQGWPILVSANSIANGPWTHS